MQGHESPFVRSTNAQTKPRFSVVAAVGGGSIAFSILCLFFVPIFGGLMFFAILAGAFSVFLALASKANRVAMVVGAFALTPIIRFSFFEQAADFFGTSYVTFYGPLAVTAAIAIWALVDYSKSRRARTSAAE
jgi:4-amino-4-deoxy-L-arabinose transferase-like glycosyltransferase